MKEYNVRAVENRDFSLFENNTEIGKIIYKNWFSIDAQILLSDGTQYSIEPIGLWDKNIVLLKDGHTILKFDMNWLGNVIISSGDENKKGETYNFTKKDFLQRGFTLLDENNKELLTISPVAEWKKMRNDYKIEVKDSAADIDVVFLLAIVHYTNYYVSSMNAIAL